MPVLVPLLNRVLTQSATYAEPFLGGASVFFGLQPDRAILGDQNPDLIHFYRYLRSKPWQLREEVEKLDIDGTSEEFNLNRKEFNNGAVGIRRAALFLYLNRTGFNGIWRVNRRGEFTVPFGKRRLSLVDLPEWAGFAKSLRGADLRTTDFSGVVERLTAGDVAFMDPPYLNSTGRELFTRYTHRGFSPTQHQRLRESIVDARGRGVHVVLTVRDDPEIRLLYKDFVVQSVDCRTNVGARGSHIQVSDLVITTFD